MFVFPGRRHGPASAYPSLSAIAVCIAAGLRPVESLGAERRVERRSQSSRSHAEPRLLRRWGFVRNKPNSYGAKSSLSAAPHVTYGRIEGMMSLRKQSQFPAPPVFAYLGAPPQEASKYAAARRARKEKRRFRGEYATLSSPLVSALSTPHPFRASRRSWADRGKNRPPADASGEQFEVVPLHPNSPLLPMAGLFFPAMNRLWTHAKASRPRQHGPRKRRNTPPFP